MGQLLRSRRARRSRSSQSRRPLVLYGQEGMALHCFEGKAPFSNATLGKIEKLKDVYELDLTAEDSHRLDERGNDD